MVSLITRNYIKYEDMTIVLVGDQEEIEKQKETIEESRKLQ